MHAGAFFLHKAVASYVVEVRVFVTWHLFCGILLQDPQICDEALLKKQQREKERSVIKNVAMLTARGDSEKCWRQSPPSSADVIRP